MLDQPYFFSIPVAAELGDKTESEFRNLITRGRLAGVKVAGILSVSRFELLPYFSSVGDAASLARVNDEISQ